MTQTSGIPFRTRADVVLNWEQRDDTSTLVDRSSIAEQRNEHDQQQQSTPDRHEYAAADHDPLEVNDLLPPVPGQSTPVVQEPSLSGETAADPAQTVNVTPIPVVDAAGALQLRVSNEFTPIKEDDWDTVLYIGPPPRQHGESLEAYAYIQAHFSQPYLMRSQTLRDTGSAVFKHRLGPTSARAQRKLQNLGLHRNLPSDGTPKYWIDLRPMQNDEEALVTVAELTCTPGILSWHKHEAAQRVDPMILRGRDFLNTPQGISDRVQLPPDFFSSNVAQFQNNNGRGQGQQSEEHNGDFVEADYSPLRHHTALERLLHAIAGDNPRLNSAAKLWNFFALAKFFDCATHPRVCNEIYTWIFSGYNSNFIAANPEVCYRIAMGTQSKMMLRIVFCILVGEKALQQACAQGPDQAPLSPMAGSRRALSSLDDNEINRIDHAARTLSLRISKRFHEIVDFPVSWMVNCTEVFKLFGLVGVDENRQAVIQVAIAYLFRYVRSEILNALSQHLNLFAISTTQTEVEGFNRQLNFPLDAISRYNHSELPQRLLTQISWAFIRYYSILRESSSLKTVGARQWSGIQTLCANWDVGSTVASRIQFESKLAAINTSIGGRQISYHGVQSHEEHSGEYEIRLDSLFHSVSCNAESTSQHMSAREAQAVQEVATQRHKKHQQAVKQYENEHAASPLTKQYASQKQLLSADSHYTTAKIDGLALLSQLSNALTTVIESEILRPGYLSNASGIEADIDVSSIDTLLCLGEEEFKFLPLWADGCDDETGGVFTEMVPGAVDEDFSGGKRGLGPDDDGIDGLDDIEMGESFSVIDSHEAESTVAGASKVATAGYGTNSVMSLDE